MRRLIVAALMAVFFVAGCAAPEQKVVTIDPPTLVGLDFICDSEETVKSLIEYRDDPDGFLEQSTSLIAGGACIDLPEIYPFILVEVIETFTGFDGPGRIIKARALQSVDKFVFALIRMTPRLSPDTSRQSTSIDSPSGYIPVHGDASWIEQHPDHGWCCGPKDCARLDPKQVTRLGSNYVVNGPEGERYVAIITALPSIDADYWACFQGNGDVRCFFHPTLGA